MFSVRAQASGVFLLCFLLALTGPALCQFDGRPKATARKEDVPLIKCQVCNLLAINAFKQVQDLKAKSTPSKKVDEMAVIELMEDISSSWKDQGDWITALHLESSGSTLTVVQQAEPGECKEACKTIERTVQDIIGEHDTDIAEKLFIGRLKESDFQKWLCTDLTSSCTAKVPSLPKGHKPYAAFSPRGSEQNVDRMLHEMEAQGLKGKVWNREDLMNHYLEGQDGMDFGGMGGDPYGDLDGADFDPSGLGFETLNMADTGAPASPDDIAGAAEEAKKLWEQHQAEQAAKQEL